MCLLLMLLKVLLPVGQPVSLTTLAGHVGRTGQLLGSPSRAAPTSTVHVLLARASRTPWSCGEQDVCSTCLHCPSLISHRPVCELRRLLCCCHCWCHLIIMDCVLPACLAVVQAARDWQRP
jgi:hypothetical protein